jgi:hypothetical protein
MDESASMTFAEQFSIQFITDLENGLLAKGLGNSAAGGNQYGLVGYGGGGVIEPGHVIPVGPNNAPFGTSVEYGVAAQTLVVSGAIEDGYSAIDLMLKSYQPRVDAAKFVILVTNEDATSSKPRSRITPRRPAKRRLQTRRNSRPPSLTQPVGGRWHSTFKNAYTDNAPRIHRVGQWPVWVLV